jgi:hypothetical protein
VADPHQKPVTAAAWALRRALRFAIATAVVALVFATTLSGEGSERLATTAYLAAIFAAIALVIQRFLPAGSNQERPVGERGFPAFLAFLFGVAVLLGLCSAFASLPGAEAFAIVAGFVIVAVAAMARSGTIATLNAALIRGGAIVAVTRYAVVLGMFGLAITALLPADMARTVADAAYRLTIVAALAIAASLIAPTRAGLFVRRCYAESKRTLDRLARLFRAECAASYAAVVAVAALFSASLFAGPGAEPFAIAAYAAAAAATFVVAVECRRLRG